MHAALAFDVGRQLPQKIQVCISVRWDRTRTAPQPMSTSPAVCVVNFVCNQRLAALRTYLDRRGGL